MRDVTLEVPDGQFLCVIGHSGSGKTTLLRLIAGLSRPTAGVLRIDGAPVEGPGLDRAVVFQNYALFPWMSALRNVEFGVEQANKELRRGLSKAQVAGVAREYLDRVGMGVAADKYPYQLSGGMRQRVAIARALAMDAEILLFDEPFGALDVKTRCSLQKLVDSLWRSGERRKTVVFVTHDINEAILLADRVVFMRRGEIVADRAVDVPRTRSSTIFASDPCAMALKDELTELFYLDGDEDEDGFGAPDAEGALGALAGEAGLV
nr:ABC transporter ATP-binding protein [Gordonibacter massiliensis (ex Traore et al. 2017)]